MDFDYRVLGLAFGIGIIAWSFEALIDSLFFYDGTFLELMFVGAPTHELYIRLAIFGTIIGFGLIASRMTCQLRERTERVQEIADIRAVISNINQLLVRERSTDQMIAKAATGLVEYERFECCSFELAAAEHTEVACETGVVAGDPDFTTQQYLERVQEQEIVEIEDVTESPPDLHEKNVPPHSGLQVAIGYMAETYGVLTVHLRPDHEPTEEDITLLEEIADDIGYFLRNQKLQADQAERERQLQTLIDNLPGFVYRCRNESGWPMEMVRGRAEELTGHTAEQLETGAVSYGADVIHPADEAMVEEKVTVGVEQDESFEITYRIRTAAGETKWVWEQGQPVEPADADDTRLEGFITDITERKELQERLRESKERYESLFKSIRNAILVVDTDRTIRNCNPAFTELFGYELADVEGMGVDTLYANPAEYAAMEETVSHHSNGDTSSLTATFERKSGHTFEGEVSLFTLHDANGDVNGYIAVIEDVTERQNRLRQVQIMDRILRHNLRNEVNVMQGYGTLIENNASPDIKPWAGEILDSTTHLLDTASKQRRITRILSEEPAQSTVDIVQILRNVISRIEEHHPNAAITERVPESAIVSATENLDIALEEILENAVVHAEADAPVVDVTVEAPPDGVTVRIEDANPPIPEMEKSIITGSAEIEQLYHGSGLGLWLVNLVVTRSDGMIEFEEGEGRGNVVTIRLFSH